MPCYNCVFEFGNNPPVYCDEIAFEGTGGTTCTVTTSGTSISCATSGTYCQVITVSP